MNAPITRPLEAMPLVGQVHGIVDETCDRIYEVSETPWFATHRPPWTLRKWGEGRWVIANGERSHFPTEEAAHEAGRRWVMTGRAG